jgi:hypothetical protein
MRVEKAIHDYGLRINELNQSSRESVNCASDVCRVHSLIADKLPDANKIPMPTNNTPLAMLVVWSSYVVPAIGIDTIRPLMNCQNGDPMPRRPKNDEMMMSGDPRPNA